MGYKVQDTVFMRSPLFSLNDSPLESAIDINDVISEYPQLKEAIAISISNIDLLTDLQNETLTQKEITTLYKYWLRSSIRPTPYGLFAGISCCKLSETTEIVKSNIPTFTKNCCIDYEWFYAVVQLLESNMCILENCKVKINSQCYLSSGRVINPYVSNYGKIDSSYSELVLKNRIKNTSPVQQVMKYAKDWIGYKELKEKILANYSDIDNMTITNFLSGLLQNEYIITDLRGILDCNDPLQKLLEKIKKYKVDAKCKEIINKLIYINGLREDYECMKLGQGIDKYLELCKSMKEIYACKNYVNVSTHMPLQKNGLSSSIKKSIEDFLGFLEVFATEDNQTPAISAYKTKFIERYGIYVEVPLFDLLDESIGLGNPYTKYENKIEETPQRKNIKKLIKDKIDICVKKGDRIVLITDTDIQLLKEYSRDNKLRLSKGFELNFVIHSNKNDGYELSVAPSFGSSGIGRLVNRFYNVLTLNGKESLDKYSKTIINDETDCIYADSTFLPKRGRNNNICNGHRNYEYSIDCGLENNNKQIDLSDILVGYNEKIDRLYLKSKKKGKVINAFSDNMLNRMVDNYYFRFLWDVSYAYQIHPIENLISLNNFWDIKYIPEIKVKDVVIQRETWKLNDYDFKNIKTFNTFIEKFTQIKKELNIPDQIIFLDFDHYLAIDTKNRFSLNLFYSELKKTFKKYNVVEIQKFQPEGLIVLDENNKKYFSEFVFECLNDVNERIMDFPTCELTHSNILNNKLISSEKKVCISSDGWFYFKIYIEKEKSNSILVENIFPFLMEHISKKEVSQFFYLRYSDPDFQIRLRIKAIENQTFFKCIDMLNNLLSNYAIKSYSVELYEREIERYGGKCLFNIIEQEFYFDSLLVLEYLEKKEKKEVEMHQEYIFGMQCVYDVLRAFINNTIEEEKFLNKVISHKEFHDIYRKNKGDFYDLFIESIKEENKQSPYFQSRNKILQLYADKIKIIDKQGKLTNSKTDIILSVIHMFCNRYNGDRIWERKILAFVRHSLHEYNSKMRYLSKLNK